MNDGIGLQPKAAPLYFARGVLYVQLAEYEKAQATLKRPTNWIPPSRSVSAAQGLAAAQQNDLDRALPTFRRNWHESQTIRSCFTCKRTFFRRKARSRVRPDFQTAMRSAKKAVALAAYPRPGARRAGEALPAVWTI